MYKKHRTAGIFMVIAVFNYVQLFNLKKKCICLKFLFVWLTFSLSDQVLGTCRAVLPAVPRERSALHVGEVLAAGFAGWVQKPSGGSCTGGEAGVPVHMVIILWECGQKNLTLKFSGFFFQESVPWLCYSAGISYIHLDANSSNFKIVCLKTGTTEFIMLTFCDLWMSKTFGRGFVYFLVFSYIVWLKIN